MADNLGGSGLRGRLRARVATRA